MGKIEKKPLRVTFIVSGPIGQTHRLWQQLESKFKKMRTHTLEIGRPSLVSVYLNLMTRQNHGSFSVHTTVEHMTQEWNDFLSTCQHFNRPFSKVTILLNKQIHDNLTDEEKELFNYFKV